MSFVSIIIIMVLILQVISLRLTLKDQKENYTIKINKEQFKQYESNQELLAQVLKQIDKQDHKAKGGKS